MVVNLSDKNDLKKIVIMNVSIVCNVRIKYEHKWPQ